MKFKSINETEKFTYDDCQLFKLIDGEGMVTAELEALIVRPDNSQNSNYTNSYAGTVTATFADGRITGAVREGCRRFDANDVLIEEIPDKQLNDEQVELLKKEIDGAYLYEVRTSDLGDGRREAVLCLECPGEDIAGTDSVIFRIEIECGDIIFAWDKYMNRVQM